VARVDRTRSVAARDSAPALALQRLYARVVGGRGLLLRFVLLAYVFDDPLRWTADGCRLPASGSSFPRRRHLPRTLRTRVSGDSEALGTMVGAQRARDLAGV